MLTGYTIDVFREIEGEQNVEDIYLDEFADEIDQWVIDAIKGMGLRTAREVLDAPRDMIVEKADLEEDTVDHVLSVLRAEFEEEKADFTVLPTIMPSSAKRVVETALFGATFYPPFSPLHPPFTKQQNEIKQSFKRI